MTDKQIINKVREWLILNIRSMTMDDELIDDNKLLLKAIRDWKNERKVWTMNYKLLKVKGYWNNDLLKSKGYLKDYSDIEQDVNIAIAYWEHIDTEDILQDDEIFYYFDLEYEQKTNIEVGDIISDGFVITKIYWKENINVNN